ncbi:hypothetical protein LTR56_016122 [Elasticomyces elasticus]|nr:hypothetical protein LTR56_016122 [Elasticomyces elasticus]
MGLPSYHSSRSTHSDDESRAEMPPYKTFQELEDLVRIQPHTDEGGDAYYIGDAYEEAKCAHEWALNDGRPRPYLDFIKNVARSMPHIEYLAHWMEVTCAPPKWKFIQDYPQGREQRAQKCKACVLDFVQDAPPIKRMFEHVPELAEAVGTKAPQDRLIIVEDLSRDLVELLGSTYDIDPIFFRTHIGDCLFHNNRDPWVELPDLDIIARKQSHLSLQYLRPRYFKTPGSYQRADRETGGFNVLRRLDSDRSHKRMENELLELPGTSVSLMRARTSLWTQPRNNMSDPILAILLVDPTTSEGHPLWGGYGSFGGVPAMHSQSEPPPTSTGLFDDIVHWSSKMSQADLTLARTEPKCIAMPMIMLVLAEWRIVSKYMSTVLWKIQRELGMPHWAESTDATDALVHRLSPWLCNMPYYKAMVDETIDRLFTPGQLNDKAEPTGMISLLQDCRIVQRQLDTIQTRIDRILNTATMNAHSVAEPRRGQDANLNRLTLLATLFVPLSFSSSFLSMSPDFTSATKTIWLFFAIAVPLTLIALCTVDLTGPNSQLLTFFTKHMSKRTVS